MAIDPVTTRAHRKKLPPTPVSKSLEGLEIGIPPIKFTNPWLSKPLPNLPDRTSSLYSRESIINSYMTGPADSRDSLVNHKKAAASESHQDRRFYRRRRNTAASRNSMSRMNDQVNRCSLTMRTFLSEEQYGIGMYLAKRPATANHYFREKKWELFPELAPQPVAQTSQTVTTTKSRKRGNLRRKRSQARRSHHKHQMSHCDNFGGLNLKPIAEYMQQTLAKKTSQLRLRKKPSQTMTSTAVTSRPRNISSSSADSGFLSVTGDKDDNTETTQRSMRRRMREMSLWKTAGSSEESLRCDNNNNNDELSWPPNPVTPSNSTWRSPVTKFNLSSSTKLNSREDDTLIPCCDNASSAKDPQCGDKKGMSPVSNHSQSSLVSLPEYAKAIQQKTSHVLLAIDGAKRKIAEARAARRRAQLKKHIRVVGPIENYPYGSVDEWV